MNLIISTSKMSLVKQSKDFSPTSRVLEISKELMDISADRTWCFRGGTVWRKNLDLMKNTFHCSGQTQKGWKRISVSSIWMLSQNCTAKTLQRFWLTGVMHMVSGIWVIRSRIMVRMHVWDMEQGTISVDRQIWILQVSM